MTSSTVRIRDARPADWPAVAGLLEQLGRPGALGTEREAALRQVFLDFLGRTDTAALVAEDAGRVLGFVNLLIFPRLNFVESQAWIPDLVVAEDARSRGIGAALLRRAEDVARERGSFSVFLTSANWRTRSHAFYRREGWDEAARYFTKGLGGIPWPPPPPAPGPPRPG